MLGRKIAKNEPVYRPWGIDAEFSCITEHCTSNHWDITWYDSGHRKRQYCEGCQVYSPYVSFDDIEGRYSNKLFPAYFPDVYWTPWPLPEETPGLFYLVYKKQGEATEGKGEGKRKGKRKGGPSDRGKEVVEKKKKQEKTK